MTGVTARSRKSGVVTFEAQVRVPRVDGRQRSPLSKSFKTEAGAQAWHDEKLAQLRNPVTVPDGPLTFEAFADAYVPKALHWSPQAKAYAAGRLQLHVIPALGHMPLADIHAGHVSDLYAELLHRAEDRLAHPTVARIHAILRQVLQAAVARKLVGTNPAADVRLPKRTDPQREIQAWNPAQVQAFLAWPGTQAGPLLSLFVVAFHTGARRSELLNLTPADVQLGADPHLFIRRSKTEKGRRRLPLLPRAVAALTEQKAARAKGPDLPPQLWLRPDGTRLSPTQVSKAFQVLVDAFVASPAGRGCGARRITLHGARHSWVTNALRSGMPPDLVSKLAGHATMSYTVDRYGHLLESHDALVRELYA